MKKEIAEKWVAALRSGKYTQGQRRLRRDTIENGVRKSEFCCLGVLCDLHAQMTEQPQAWNGETYLGTTGFLPFTVVDWAGMIGRDKVFFEGGYRHFVELNDGTLNFRPQSFLEIADIIERHWQEL